MYLIDRLPATRWNSARRARTQSTTAASVGKRGCSSTRRRSLAPAATTGHGAASGRSPRQRTDCGRAGREADDFGDELFRQHQVRAHIHAHRLAHAGTLAGPRGEVIQSAPQDAPDGRISSAALPPGCRPPRGVRGDRRDRLVALGDEAGWRPEPGEWSANECVGHLIEAERRGFAGRIRAILAADRPTSRRTWKVGPAGGRRARRDHHRAARTSRPSSPRCAPRACGSSGA